MERAGRNMPIMVKNDEVRRGLWDLARAHRILELEGHNDMSLGHCSMRDPWDRGVWLKRGNIGLEEVHESGFHPHRLRRRRARRRRHPAPRVADPHRDPARALDLNFVCHTHPLHGTLFSCTREKLQAYTNEGCWFSVLRRITSRPAI